MYACAGVTEFKFCYLVFDSLQGDKNKYILVGLKGADNNTLPLFTVND